MVLFYHLLLNDQVRERAKQIAELLHDEKRLGAERKKAKENSKKYTAASSEDYRGGMGSSSYKDSSYTYGGNEYVFVLL